MKRMRVVFTAFLLGLAVMACVAQEPDSGPHLVSQAAADVLRDFTGADGAFLAAGDLKSGASKDNLASILVDRTDTPVVVSLTGAQVRQAIDRSISFYPQSSPIFLQLSGFEVTFKKDPSASPRITSITANGVKLDDSRTYNVAMPSTLARGQLGYFKIWDKNKITKTFPATATMESVLKGKRYVDSTPRYMAVD